MDCAHFDAARCRSCERIGWTRLAQLDAHEREARTLLAAWPDVQWLPSVASAETGFRNKAKMVVSGSVEAPVLGILDATGVGVDLGDCALYPHSLQACFAPLRAFIGRARLAPYDLASRRGELKHVLLTQDPTSGGLLLRFVLRSREALDRIRRELPWLQQQLPDLAVVSVNLQPVHQAILEGPVEDILTDQQALAVTVNALPLLLRPQSFFQTNTAVAAALYTQVRDWVDACQPATVLDLYCGVGGFALHCARPGRIVRGVELSAEAVTSAQCTAERAGLSDVSFEAADATGLRADQLAAELVIVNPPRRGIGPQLAGRINAGPASTVVYSSCNAQSLARDLLSMPDFRLRRAQVFQMFPHTAHFELLTLLERR